MKFPQEICILNKYEVKSGGLKMSVTFFTLIFNPLEMLYLTETILQKLHDFLTCCCKLQFIWFWGCFGWFF